MDFNNNNNKIKIFEINSKSLIDKPKTLDATTCVYHYSAIGNQEIFHIRCTLKATYSLVLEVCAVKAAV